MGMTPVTALCHPPSSSPTWSEFQHVSSLASNMCFFPNCFTSRLRTELTLRGHVPPSRGHDGDSVSEGSPVLAQGQGTAWGTQKGPALGRGG